MDDVGTDLTPLAELLCAHAGKAGARHRALWRFDARLAQIARTTTEAAIGQMRLAWWHDVVTDGTGLKGKGDPDVDNLRATGGMAMPGLVSAIEGWEVLVVEPEMDRHLLRLYAVGRGEGLFRALSGCDEEADGLSAAGRLWALWDLAGHVGDDDLRNAAIALGQEECERAAMMKGSAVCKPLRMLATLARQDIKRGKGAPAGISRSLALRLLRIAVIGR
ncbi:MAG: hypothetical protein QM605_11140 [Sphingobium sp.]